MMDTKRMGLLSPLLSLWTKHEDDCGPGEPLVLVTDEDYDDLAHILVYAGQDALTPYWRAVLWKIVSVKEHHDRFRERFQNAVLEEVELRDAILAEVEALYRAFMGNGQPPGDLVSHLPRQFTDDPNRPRLEVV